ncbi:MAG: antitoxin VapB family protein [Nanoarchaeota archaeon]
MATKTISITEDAYYALKEKKTEHESFSDVILRFSGKKSLESFFGALCSKTADAIEDDIKEMRSKHKEMHKKRVVLS